MILFFFFLFVLYIFTNRDESNNSCSSKSEILIDSESNSNSNSNSSSKIIPPFYSETIISVIKNLEFHRISTYNVPYNELEIINENTKHICIWFMNKENDILTVDNVY